MGHYVIGGCDWEMPVIKHDRLNLEDSIGRENASWYEQAHGIIWFLVSESKIVSQRDKIWTWKLCNRIHRLETDC